MSEQNDKKEDSPVEGVQKDLSQRIDEVINEDNQNKEKVEPSSKDVCIIKRIFIRTTNA